MIILNNVSEPWWDEINNVGNVRSLNIQVTDGCPDVGEERAVFLLTAHGFCNLVCFL